MDIIKKYIENAEKSKYQSGGMFYAQQAGSFRGLPPVERFYKKKKEEVIESPTKLEIETERLIKESKKKKLQRGVIVDKRKNEAYIVDDGKIIKDFPVLTASNVEGNRNDYSLDYLEKYPEFRTTPIGAYSMKLDKDIYGEKGFRLNPINAFLENAPKAKDLAEHVVYHPQERGKLFNMSPELRNASYGCVNCRKDDINYITDRFSDKDTTLIIDSNRREDADLINRMSKQQGGKYTENEKKFLQAFAQLKLM